jgi:large subunit ribosomal protein L21
MFAVVKTGGKQYRVSTGDLLKVERLEGEAGQTIDFSSVLLINDEGKISVGTPLLDKVKVRATILEQTRGDKIIVFKKKRRQGYRRKAGHRQDLTVIRVEEILLQGESRSSSKKTPSATAATKAAIKEKADFRTETETLQTQAPALEAAAPETKKVDKGEGKKTKKKTVQEPSVSEKGKSE